jgi:RloB-like protein
MTPPSRNRKITSKAKRLQLMLFVEGSETEPGYFSHWYRLYRDRVIVKIAPHRNVTTPYELVDMAIRQRAADIRDAKRGKGDTFDEYWCVFDVDNHPHLEDALTLADREDINVALSNPCIELWLIIHFKSQTAYIERGTAEAEAKKILKCGKVLSIEALKRLIRDYEKAKSNALALDKKHEGDESSAHSNPSSGVWRLIDVIQGIPNAR